MRRVWEWLMGWFDGPDENERLARLAARTDEVERRAAAIHAEAVALARARSDEATRRRFDAEREARHGDQPYG